MSCIYKGSQGLIKYFEYIYFLMRVPAKNIKFEVSLIPMVKINLLSSLKLLVVNGLRKLVKFHCMTSDQSFVFLSCNLYS